MRCIVKCAGERSSASLIVREDVAGENGVEGAWCHRGGTFGRLRKVGGLVRISPTDTPGDLPSRCGPRPGAVAVGNLEWHQAVANIPGPGNRLSSTM